MKKKTAPIEWIAGYPFASIVPIAARKPRLRPETKASSACDGGVRVGLLLFVVDCHVVAEKTDSNQRRDEEFKQSIYLQSSEDVPRFWVILKFHI